MKTISIDTTKDTIDHIKEKLRPLIDSFVHAVPRYKPETKIYRAVDYSNDKLFKIGDISYPPSDCVVDNQRASRANQSMFYGSLQVNSPFFECVPNKGSYMVIATWSFKNSPKLNKVGYDQSVLSELGMNRNLNSWQSFSENIDQRSLEIARFFAKAFLLDATKSQDIYKLSIAIAELFTYSDSIDGLIYPSVASNGNFDNIVLKPEYVDKYLQFESAEYVVVKDRGVTDAGHRKVDLTKIDVATGLDQYGYINWQKDNCILRHTNKNEVMIKYRDSDGLMKAKFEQLT